MVVFPLEKLRNTKKLKGGEFSPPFLLNMNGCLRFDSLHIANPNWAGLIALYFKLNNEAK